MKAVTWHGPQDVRFDSHPDPEILNPHDAILAVKQTAICGSDLHLYNGLIPSMKPGDILGHEFAGEIVAVGKEVKNRQVGDRVVVAFPIACGRCTYCARQQYSLCDNTNPNAAMTNKFAGYPTAGIYGYSHLYGGYAGGQAQYVRVPFADVGTCIIPEELSVEQALFLSDIFPTGYMAAENCEIKPGDTIAVWGCGPVGLFAIKSALMLGADRVIAIDRFEARLRLAQQAGAEVINYETQNVLDIINETTGGRGPDACIDAVGMEAHGHTVDSFYDDAMQRIRFESDRSHALREAIRACGKGGIISMPGVYSGLVDKFPLGIAFAKGLTFKMGQTHAQRYFKPLMKHIREGNIDPTFLITHRWKLADAPLAYDMWTHKADDCVKFVLS